MEIDFLHTNLDRSANRKLVKEFYDFFQFFFLEEPIGGVNAKSIERFFVEIGQGHGFPAAGFLQKDALPTQPFPVCGLTPLAVSGAEAGAQKGAGRLRSMRGEAIGCLNPRGRIRRFAARLNRECPDNLCQTPWGNNSYTFPNFLLTIPTDRDKDRYKFTFPAFGVIVK